MQRELGPSGTRSRRAGVFAGVAVLVVPLVALSGTPAGAVAGVARATHGGSSPAPQLFSKGAKVDWGPNCDPSTGRVKVPTLYAPPCVKPFTGDNGGATSLGVTKDTITIAVYESQPDFIQQSFFKNSGSDASVKAEEATQKAYVDFFQSHYEMYGRKVRLVFLKASGSDDDDAAAKSDAIKVATEIKAFASWGGPSQTTAYADELAARHVLCLGDCTLAVPEKFVTQRSPYIWPTEEAPEQASVHWAEFIGKELAGGKAKYAGDGSLTGKTRRFGLIRYDDDTGTFRASAQTFVKGLKKYKVKLAANAPYALDLTKIQDDARVLIAKMKAAKVTSVIFAGDFFTPRYLTAEATKQNYFPEWVITGTVYTDTSLFGRTYDQRQWAHAFGVSLIPAPTSAALDDFANVITWQTGQPPAAKTYKQLVQAPLIFFTGVHLAGPRLTPESFAAGLFRYPSAAGTAPTRLHLSWGKHKIWPGTDYFGGDDATLVWWNPAATGVDEVGEQGTGMYEYANGGRRYLPGQWPKQPAQVFDPSTSVTVFDSLPADQRPPSYPSPVG